MSKTKIPKIKRLTEKDMKTLGWLKVGGREGAKEDFEELLKRAAPTKKAPKS